jgi:hypothetical protein
MHRLRSTLFSSRMAGRIAAASSHGGRPLTSCPEAFLLVLDLLHDDQAAQALIAALGSNGSALWESLVEGMGSPCSHMSGAATRILAFAVSSDAHGSLRFDGHSLLKQACLALAACGAVLQSPAPLSRAVQLEEGEARALSLLVLLQALVSSPGEWRKHAGSMRQAWERQQG